MSSTTGEASLSVRAARRGDAPEVAALLYESAAARYDQFAGDRGRARVLLERSFRRRGNTASCETISVVELEGRVAGVLAAFPSAEGDRRARRFLRMALVGMAPWRWAEALQIFRLGTDAVPPPPGDALYVDALATSAALRRRGAGRALLAEAERRARDAGLVAVALDTGERNAPARALYERSGFVVSARRDADGAMPGLVAYVKRL